MIKWSDCSINFNSFRTSKILKCLIIAQDSLNIPSYFNIKLILRNQKIKMSFRIKIMLVLKCIGIIQS